MVKCVCVILNYNDWEHTADIVKRVENYATFLKLVVVDNCSTDDSMKHLMKLQNEKVTVIQSTKNKGYGFGNNYGMRYAFQKIDANAVLICNPDVFFDEKLVIRLIGVLETYQNCGVVSAVQYDRNENEINQSAWKIPPTWVELFSVGKIGYRLTQNNYHNAEFLHRNPITKVDCVAGSLLLISRRLLKKLADMMKTFFCIMKKPFLDVK